MGDTTMTEQWTPTTDDVRRAGYLLRSAPVVRPDAFDRWLAARDAEVAANALRDLAVRVRSQWSPESCPWVGALDDEADRIEREAANPELGSSEEANRG